jgi:hypothetical protein
MDFHDLLFRYFGTAEIDALNASALTAGLDRMRVDFGLETNAGRRFALWALMHMLGDAPDLDAFEDAEEREAARRFMDLADSAGSGD